MGAELSVVGEALAGLQGNWFYVAGSVAGAAGGGVAAYYWVDFDGQYGPQFLVAGAFALFVPAMIGIASSQYYRPETDLRRGPPSELGLSLQLPQVYVGDSYTRDQRQLFGLQRSSDFTFYLLNGVF